MSNLPSFPTYHVIKELGSNLQGGRVVYLAKNTDTDALVVIKQFQFAKSQTTWSGFKQTERERDILRSLKHERIPTYLDSFETNDGFCIVQEYKEAQPLSTPRSFEPYQVKEIAVQILEILIYLQNLIPPVFHRDIKPENILVDEHFHVYLIDFGFARIGGGEGAMSSVAAGTFGFMAPEQIYYKELTEATDLYGLGATLICLLTSTKSRDMNALTDEDGRIVFKHLVSKLDLQFIEWLEKMTEPRMGDRYPNAKTSLALLKPLNVINDNSVKLREAQSHKLIKLGEISTNVVTKSDVANKNFDRQISTQLIIEARNVVAGYVDGVDILQGANLSVYEGELVTVIGSNGAGKSTLAKAIFGLVPVRSGEILFGDRNLIGLKPEQIVRQGISYVPQVANVFPSLSVSDNLDMGAYTREGNIAAVKDKIYTTFPVLAKRRNQRAGTLSGGERQMLAMGRALMLEPKLLILDEPSAALSPILVQDIFNLIQQINQTGTSIILVEQNARKALAIADRGYVMHLGKDEFTGKGADLLNDPEVTELYLGMGNFGKTA